ncbi:MAG: hydrogenase maturation protease [Verrucomicrobia bacterium]|nr:MAG: hydrogenase maturation protease [Verrucomicrobiota bacterium]
MDGVTEQTRAWNLLRQEPACWVGLGNPDWGDDGLGVALAERLAARGVEPVVVAGTNPERWTGRIARSGARQAVFLDAVEFGGEPGAVALWEGAELRSRFPQVSTHKLSLGALATWLEQAAGMRTWVLGVQPAALRAGAGLSPAAARTVELLADWIAPAAGKAAAETAVEGGGL